LKNIPVKDASLYIHIPFCSSFCDYCDFFSVTKNNFNDEYIDAYLSALINDIEFQISLFNVKNIPTAYIGGGTPSVLGKKINILLNALNSIEQFSPAELTIEANPESITKEFLGLCKDGGINRLSLGVQTFNEKCRMAVNRKGSAYTLNENLSLAAKYFPSSLSADLITGLPFQTKEIISDDIKNILEYKPCHVSLYGLSLENDTPLKEKINKKIIELPDDDIMDNLWLFGRDLLVNEGFDNYEISNFALNGKRCLHNMRYWQMQNWLGAGAGASGTIINEKETCAKRYTYKNDIDLYIKNSNIKNAVIEHLEKDTLIRDSILMGYRLKEGPNEEIFKERFGFTAENCIPKTFANWKDKNKMLFLNKFLSEAFDELDTGK